MGCLLETKALNRFGCGALALSLVAGLLAHPAEAQPQNVTVYQVSESTQFLPLYVAIDQGIFKKNGLNVEKVTAGSGTTAVAAVIGGHADFSLQDPMTAVFADQRGAHVISVAMVDNGAPVWIIASPHSSVKDLSDLSGKAISSALVPSTSTYLLERLLKQENMASTSVDMVELGTEIAPVEAGRAAAAALYEPQVDEGISSGYKVIYSFASQYPGGYAFSVMDALASTIKNKPKMVQAFVTSLTQADAVIRQSPATARTVAEKEFPSLPKAVVDNAVNRLIAQHIYPTSSDISRASFQNALALQEFFDNVKPGSVTYGHSVNDTFAEAENH
jgi:NitT/TauT family transport system substrate-binding protein